MATYLLGTLQVLLRFCACSTPRPAPTSSSIAATAEVATTHPGGRPLLDGNNSVWLAAPVAVVVVCTLVVVVLVADVLVIVVLVRVVHVCVVLFTRGRVSGGGGVAFVARRDGGVAFVARSVAGATSSEHAYSEDWNPSHAFMYLPAPSLHDTQPNPAN